MAYKVFTNGSTLQASELNENLMRQSVAVFSNAAARTAAITSPSEGMVTWLEDSNTIQIYDGSSWKVSLSPTGSVLQVVSAVSTTQAQTSSLTFVTTGLEATITPKSSSNKILILSSGDAYPLAAGRSLFNTIFRGGAGGTDLGGPGSIGFGAAYGDNSGNVSFFSITHLDSPNTTSATTYTLMHRSANAGLNVRGIQQYGSITLLEIAG